MTNVRKRLEALSEIFESEKSYVYEMRLWSTEFRKILLNTKHIPIKRRVLLNSYIFLNVEDITRLHECILSEMVEKNQRCRENAKMPPLENISARIDLKNELEVYADLDYTEILEKYLHKFDIYKYYLEMFPKTEFIFKREMTLNVKFGEEVKVFLDKTGYSFMGYKHFMTRPSQKLNRYPLLLNGIYKRTENEDTKKRIKVINEFLMHKTKEFDKLFGIVKNAFWLYDIHHAISYKEKIKKKLALGFFMKERKIVQISTDIFVRSIHHDEPAPFKIYLTDNMLIVIDVVVLPFGEKLFVVDEPVPFIKYILLDKFPDDIKIKYFQEKHKFMLKEIDGDHNICLYFKTEAQCKELRTAILKGMEFNKSKYNPQIELVEFGPIGDEVDDIVIPDTYFIDRSFSDEEEIRLSKHILETINTNLMKSKNKDAEQNETETELRNKSNISENTDDNKKNKDIQNNVELNANESTISNNELLIKQKKEFLEINTDCIDITLSENNQEDSMLSLNNDLDFKIENMKISGFEDYTDDVESATSDNQRDKENYKAKQDRTIMFDTERLRKSNEIFVNATSLDGNDNDVLFFLKLTGVFMKRKNEIKCIHPRFVKKFIYVSQYNLICYIDDNACYWSQIPTTDLETNLICYKADNIWFGNTTNTFFLVVKLVSKTNSSFLHLFEIKDGKFSLITQLYIGADISQLIFLTSLLIVCCVDFEVINMYTLDTHELLNTNDMFIDLLHTNQHPTIAMDVFKVEKGKYLVCNDKIGFYINQYGSCLRNTPFFVWYNVPTEFKMFNNYVIVLYKEGMVVYNAITGEIVRWVVKIGLRFVKCCVGVWVHNGTTLFEVKLPLMKI